MLLIAAAVAGGACGGSEPGTGTGTGRAHGDGGAPSDFSDSPCGPIYDCTRVSATECQGECFSFICANGKWTAPGAHACFDSGSGG